MNTTIVAIISIVVYCIKIIAVISIVIRINVKINYDLFTCKLLLTKVLSSPQPQSTSQCNFLLAFGKFLINFKKSAFALFYFVLLALTYPIIAEQFAQKRIKSFLLGLHLSPGWFEYPVLSHVDRMKKRIR